MNRYLTKAIFKLATECPTKLFYTGKDQIYKNTKDEFKCADPKSSSICGDVVCTGTEKCTDGKCKPPVPPKKKNKCGNTFCTGNQTCYNNICMDLPDIDTNLFTQS